MQALFARATAQVKNVGFMCFMAYMTGNAIQIFSILMTFNLLSAPMSAIMSSGQSESPGWHYASHGLKSSSHGLNCLALHVRHPELGPDGSPGWHYASHGLEFSSHGLNYLTLHVGHHELGRDGSPGRHFASHGL
jgi:hypothetical protein